MEQKKPILDIMIDLETASIKENAALLSWTMLPFSPKGEEVNARYFHRVISLTSCFLAGMDIDTKTQNWWTDQDPLAKEQLLMEENVTISQAANDAFDWLSELGETYDLYLWSRGIDFDLPKMAWCFTRFAEEDESKMPFKYSHKMDVRTILKWMKINPLDYEFKGIKHCSFDDCAYDVMLVQEAYKKLTRNVEGEEWTGIPGEALSNFGRCLRQLGANSPADEYEESEEEDEEKTEAIHLPYIQLLVKHGFYSESPNTLSWKDLLKIENEIALCHDVIKAHKDRIGNLERNILELNSK